MNDIQCLIDRQLGIYCRPGYDNVLKRLVVREADSFHGLAAPGADDPPIFACRFAETRGLEHILALANEDGRVAIQNISKSGSESSLESFQCHNNAVFDLAWMPGHMNFVTVSGDHTACLWDVAEGSPKRVLVFSNHTRSVKCAVFRPGEPAVFATGARDGHVLVWDVRAAAQPALVLKPDNQLLSCHASLAPRTPGSHGKRARLDTHRAISITGLAFRDERTLLSCGECDGNIKAWDMRKNYSAFTREPLPKHSIPYCGGSTKNGYTNLIVDEARVRLYASCMDNVIYCFNVSTYAATPERRYVGHENGTFYIKTGLSPCGRYLVSGSSDKHAYVWSVRASRPLVRLAGHRAEVTCAAWPRLPEPALVTCSDDARHMVWRVGSELDARAGPAALLGRAASPPRAPSPPAPHWRPADATPTSLKRRARTTPADRADRAARCKRDTPAARNSKRCLADLMNAARDADEETTAKRARLAPPADRADHARPDRADRGSPAKRRRLEPAEDALPATWDGAPTPDARTPTKDSSPRDVLAPLSPNEPPPESPRTRVRLFTAELPDFVRDGAAPHLRLMSPCKRKAEAPDWLTLMSRGKRARPADAAPPPAPLSPKENAPARRSSASERTPKPAKRSGTLLKYFTIKEKV